jgi:hypothetical protein
MLKKIRTTELPISHGSWKIEGDIRGTESENTVCLGDLGLGLQVPEDGVLAKLSVSLWCLGDDRKRRERTSESSWLT